MARKTTPAAGKRRDHPPRNVQPKNHDPYRAERKAGDAVVCQRCGLVWHGGRWYRGAPPLGDERAGLCPACQRIRDKQPAGTLHLRKMPSGKWDEIEALVRHVAAREEAEHPLERVIDIARAGDDAIVTTTGAHLPRAVAHALERAFTGKAAIRFLPDEYQVTVDWHA